MGFLLGIGGAITYAPGRSRPLLRAIGEELGPRVFLLETDCPYLSPQPRRGARNEPAFLPFILEALASALGLAAADIERSTDAAARELFALPSADSSPENRGSPPAAGWSA